MKKSEGMRGASDGFNRPRKRSVFLTKLFGVGAVAAGASMPAVLDANAQDRFPPPLPAMFEPIIDLKKERFPDLTDGERTRVQPVIDRMDEIKLEEFIVSDAWTKLKNDDRTLFLRAVLIPKIPQPGDGGNGGDGGGGNDGFYNLFMRQRVRYVHEMGTDYRKLMASMLDSYGSTFFLTLFTERPRPQVLSVDIPFIEHALRDSRAEAAEKVKFVREAVLIGDSRALREKWVLMLRAGESLALRDKTPWLADPKDPFFKEFHQGRSLFRDEAVARADKIHDGHLPDDLRNLDALERYEWKVMISRNLSFRGRDITPENVMKMAETMKEMRLRIKDYPIFGDTLLAAHEELDKDGSPFFGKKTLRDEVAALSTSFKFIWSRIDIGNGKTTVTRESLRRAAEGILNRIRGMKSPQGKGFAFLADMHGGGDKGGALYLSDGQIIVKGKRQHIHETSRTRKITAEQVARAFIDRHKKYPEEAETITVTVAGEVWVLPKWPRVIALDSCSSSNNIRTIADILAKAKVPLPFMFASSEFDQYGYTNDETYGSDFWKNTILQKYKGPNITPTLGGIFEYNKQQRGSNPVLFVPGPDGILMQLSQNEWFDTKISSTA